jgi:hypothetical protein
MHERNLRRRKPVGLQATAQQQQESPMPKRKDDPGSGGNDRDMPHTIPDHPPIPEVEHPDPRSRQFKEEVREEIEKEKLDP